jgi:hypothetical protein
VPGSGQTGYELWQEDIQKHPSSLARPAEIFFGKIVIMHPSININMSRITHFAADNLTPKICQQNLLNFLHIWCQVQNKLGKSCALFWTNWAEDGPCSGQTGVEMGHVQDKLG